MQLDAELFRYSCRTSHGQDATLIVDRMPKACAVSIGLWFHAGSAYERDGEEGLSHFVEHMLFKGAGDMDAQTLSRVIDREGGSLNAFTEREAVCIHCTLPADKAALALSVLLDMAYRPRFTAEEFELEKDIIASEVLAAEDDLEEAGQDEFYSMSYPGQPIGKRIAGTVESVRALRFEALKAFHERHFLKGPLLITVAGDLRTDELVRIVEERLGSASGHTPAVSAGHQPSLVAGSGIEAPKGVFVPARVMRRAAGSQVYVFTGMPLREPLCENDYWKLSLISSAYGESMSSRLFMRIREREGLCYSIGTSMSFSRLAGLWGISSACSPVQFPRFASAYAREAEELYEHGLQAEEILEALSRIRGMLRIASDDVDYRMNRLARQYLFDGRSETVAETLVRLDEPSLGDPDHKIGRAHV